MDRNTQCCQNVSTCQFDLQIQHDLYQKPSKLLGRYQWSEPKGYIEKWKTQNRQLNIGQVQNWKTDNTQAQDLLVWYLQRKGQIEKIEK